MEEHRKKYISDPQKNQKDIPKKSFLVAKEKEKYPRRTEGHGSTRKMNSRRVSISPTLRETNKKERNIY